MPESIILSQAQDTPISRLEYPDFLCRYGYTRSQDSVESEEAGQDYLLIKANEKNLVFAVCDGVSESFMGDIAARFVGETLLSWFAKLDINTANSTHIKTELEVFLTNITTAAQIQVNNYTIPENEPAMLREVLAEKKKAGSEAMFCAGFIDIAAQKSILAWMGDIRLRIWDDSGEQTTQLEKTFKKEERWSTRLGLVGELHTLFLPLNTVQRILVYTDGLSHADTEMSVSVDDRTLTRYIAEANRRDDIALLDILFELQEQPVYIPLPPPEVRLEIENNQLIANWPEFVAAKQYQVVVSWLLKQPTWSIPLSALSEQTNSLRVRAWDGEKPGEWSNYGSANLQSIIQNSLVQEVEEDVKADITNDEIIKKKRRIPVVLTLTMLIIFGIGIISGIFISHYMSTPAIINPLLYEESTITPSPTISILDADIPTPIITPSVTITPSPSPTITPSPSPTITSSPSPTITSSPSPTITSSPSPTITSSPSPTITSSPSPTITLTLTTSPTITPTVTTASTQQP